MYLRNVFVSTRGRLNNTLIHFLFLKSLIVIHNYSGFGFLAVYVKMLL